jgi:hypothetical protein
MVDQNFSHLGVGHARVTADDRIEEAAVNYFACAVELDANGLG